MNLNDYEKNFSTYQDFAKTVKFIIKEALLKAEHLPRPQSIQCRAKAIDSLRHRLDEERILDTQTLEHDRRDLAGVRIIFYTNNDVDNFLSSSLIRENFEIEDDSTKIHHPIPENEEAKYRGIHYTVQLREDRTHLPEYARFAGLRCEIQVQTILNHAWSETSHDILYKDKLGHGFGGKAMEGIKSRFDRIMDKYLIPAGYEIQKAQKDYERLRQGKELFDKDIVKLLNDAQNNNDRYEILSALQDYAIPNYDDRQTAFKELRDPLLRAVRVARATAPVNLETPYGNMKGVTSDSITNLVVEIIASLRYTDVMGILQLLIDIYRDEPSDKIRRQIENVVEKLSEYNFDVYKQVGPMIQMALVDHLDNMSNADVDSIRPIALKIWTEAIKSEITGTKWTAESLVLSTGVVPTSEQVLEIRDKAIKALFEAYDRSTDDEQRRSILLALDNATRTPNQGEYSNELIAVTLKDSKRIVDFVIDRSAVMSYELLQHLEHRFFYDYLRAKDHTKDTENRFGCQPEASALVGAIFRFRDKINADKRYTRYKVLVGYESIFPSHWDNEEFDISGADDYRKDEVSRYIKELKPESEKDWFDLIERCAKTKSNDLATFPVFGDFIKKLAEIKPDIAVRLLSRASEDLRTFLPSFLNGLALSERSDTYRRVLEDELKSARNLSGVAHHLRFSKVTNPDFASRLLQRAIETGDRKAVIECFLFAIQQYGTDKIEDSDSFLGDALTFLNKLKDPSWVSGAWFLQKVQKFYDELTPERMRQILKNLGFVSRINSMVERILIKFAERQPDAVWDFFGDRLARETDDEDKDERFEAVPFEFHGLEEELSKDPQLAISKGLSWHTKDSSLFRYRGGRLLSATFPNCSPEFAEALVDLVSSGGEKEAEFVLAILKNYYGETSTYVVLKEIVSRFPDDEGKMEQVRIAIDNTGVVSGAFGLVEAWRTKKESLAEWLTDERPEVKSFAEKHIAELNLMIASEQRRVETEKEMRRMDYELDE